MNPYIYPGIHPKAQLLIIEQAMAGKVITEENPRSERYNSIKTTVPHTTERIIEVVALACGMTTDQLKGRGRSGEVFQARQIAMYLIRVIHNTPYASIGKMFGRNHDTTMAAIKKADDLLDFDKKFQADFNRIMIHFKVLPA